MEVDEGSDQTIRHITPLGGCACVFEECIYGGRKVPYSREMALFMFFGRFYPKKLDEFILIYDVFRVLFIF